MIKTKPVTVKQAQATLAAIRHQFHTYLDPILGSAGRMPEPTLAADWDGEGHWAIVWEEGPSDWAHRVTDGGTSEEERVLAAHAAAEFGFEYKPSKGVSPAVLPKGVHVEPYYSFVAVIYPA